MASKAHARGSLSRRIALLAAGLLLLAAGVAFKVGRAWGPAGGGAAAALQTHRRAAAPLLHAPSCPIPHHLRTHTHSLQTSQAGGLAALHVQHSHGNVLGGSGVGLSLLAARSMQLTVGAAAADDGELAITRGWDTTDALNRRAAHAVVKAAERLEKERARLARKAAAEQASAAGDD